MTAHTQRHRETVFRLFKSFANDAPLAAIDKLTATDFFEQIGKLDPDWHHIEGAQELPLNKLYSVHMRTRKPNWPHLNLFALSVESRFFGFSRNLSIVEKSANRSGRLTNRTINSYIHALSGVFRLAGKEGPFERRNPFAGRTLGVSVWAPRSSLSAMISKKAQIFEITDPERVIDQNMLKYAVIGSGHDMAFASLRSRHVQNPLPEYAMYDLLAAIITSFTAAPASPISTKRGTCPKDERNVGHDAPA